MAKAWTIAIDKPRGMTSYDVIRHLKRNFEKDYLRKIGHMGTLDPFASGVLIVTGCGGSRVQDYCHRFLSKTYLATGVFGEKTNSADCEGEIIEQNSSSIITDLRKVDWQATEKDWKKRFFNEYCQEIPQFSAVKHNGKKLYEYAREGIHVQKPPVKRFIYNFSIVKVELPKITFEVTCSSGTYIRQLFEDMAEMLGVFGHLQDLVRTKIGSIGLDSCISLDDCLDFNSSNTLKWNEFLPFQSAVLDRPAAEGIHNGRSVSPIKVSPPVGNLSCWDKELAWIETDEQEVVGLGSLRNEVLSPLVNF